MKKFIFLAFKLFFCVFIVIKVHAADQNKPNKKLEIEKKIVGKAGNWVGIETINENKRVCYGLIYNIKRFGNLTEPKKKGKVPYIMINYTKGFKVRIAVFFGYKLLRNSDVFLSLDGKQITLKTYEDYAISQDYTTDQDIIATLRHTQKVLIRAEAPNHSYSIDEYDTTQFGKLDGLIRKKCAL